MFDPHHTFDAVPGYVERYLDRLDKIPLPDYVEGELADKPPCHRTDHHGAYGGRCGFAFDQMTETDHRMVRASYWSMCDLIDARIGRLLDVLDQTGQRENTLIVFTSDHGEMLGDHGIYLKGPYFYEQGIRVPLIVTWPGRVEARRSAALVELVDLAPALLEAAALPRHRGMQGRSLWPLLVGEAAPDRHRDDVYCEYYNAMPFHREPTAQGTMVRTERHKLVVDHANDTGELYDMSADPGEHRNLWDSTAEVGVKSDMLLRMTRRMAGTVDPLPERIADW
jgi:arylsulfatase A-like enzyme